MRRDNGRPEILASSLPPSSVSLADGDRPMVLCPEGCGGWAYVQRGLLRPHHVTHKVRCPGSGQRIRIDLTLGEHRARLFKAERSADNRRGTRVHIVLTPPVPPSLCRMAQAA